MPLKRTWHRRTLMLSPWLVEVLEAHARLLADVRQLAGQKWRENDLLFPSEVGTPQRAANVWLSFQRLLRRAGLKPMKFHNLRHTAASLALQADVPMWKVSKMLGHRDITTTFRIYSHLTPEGREDVAERMEQVLRPAKTGVKTGVKHVESASNGPLLNLEKVPGGE
jgi:integrase